jgi:hypothetical protein
MPERLPMTIMMPASDQMVLDRRDAIVRDLKAIVPGEGVISSAAEMLPYESDALTAYRQPPMVVVLPETTEQVSRVLKYCFDNGIAAIKDHLIRCGHHDRHGRALRHRDRLCDRYKTLRIKHILHVLCSCMS